MAPDNRGYKSQYREFSIYDEFKDLTEEELRFVYFYANETSPYVQKIPKDEKKRCQQVTEVVYGDTLDDMERDRWNKGVFPQHIQAAIERMRHVSVEIRLKAKILVRQVFENLSRLLMLDKAVEDAMDTDEKKKYSDFALKVGKEMPDLVDILEYGFAIKGEKAAVISEAMGSMTDIIHENS